MLIRLSILVALLGTAFAAAANNDMPEDHIVVDGMNGHGRRLMRGGGGNHEGCPTDDSFDPKCLESVMPPYPICTKLPASEWVKKGIDGASRCCGDDLSECKCPVKDSEKFLNKIGAHCEGIETCKTQFPALELEGVSSVERVALSEEDISN
jgi:hypothetical protein